VLEAQAEQLAQSGAYGLALEFALAAVRADELRESGHRVVIKIHLAEGNLIEARRAYDQCAALLASEIGVPPSEATTALLPTQLMADRGLSALGEAPGYF
jgi:DNA-binding SARP family transcriptional activator